MKRLTPIDTAFLLMEKRQQPLHVGALILCTPPPGAPPDFANQLAERLRHCTTAASPFNRRLTGGGAIKFWSEDEDFDIAHHFVHLALPKPGRIRELLAMVSRVHSQHLDRAYPLWRAYLIEGLEDGRIALYFKIHHSLVDGIAGIRLMMKSMSIDVEDSLLMPAPWGVRTRKTQHAALPIPTPGAGTFSALTRLAGSGYKSVPAVVRQLRQTLSDSRNKHPEAITSLQAPRCILNQKVSGSRRFAAQSYSTPRVKAIAKAFNATANDVVLALCGSALRRYLMELNELPDRPLIALVPVSTRHDDSESGNEIAFALASLATDVVDPADRLRAVKASMDYTKERFRQMTPSQVLAYSAALITPGALAWLTGLDRKYTIANTVISHVPGPRRPLYWQGCKLDGIYPASLVLDDFALNITLISRHDFIDFGIIACRKNLPRVQKLLGYIEEAIVELETTLAPEVIEVPKKKRA
ncbi:WS/DGAT/MGAT family O-acyltransferase [Stenotrophobium rhamnosiphilum]|uniref:diacylglycerol O-acyltransferase n=1 Tax=Stenotrophobium rhamnosiphilum TaxID=2029166 RepID=A0A2T5MKH5_9GAMM|nr:wax ester/triacylglycerol synthase family O-acyltransferase [Stenotrophobium rhamnosiphilum]PTU33064.1 wax ester/triacylglycerol synthase family O-acyltransferase [Stenotrophobium rhamnosiphilum]